MNKLYSRFLTHGHGLQNRLNVLILIAALLLLVPPLQAQFLPSSHPLALTDSILDPNVYTVLLTPSSNPLAPPILGQNDSDPLILHFDYLARRAPRLVYRVIHCNEEWIPSNAIIVNECDPYLWIPLDPPELSTATRFPFFHYTLSIPNHRTPLPLSGNYVLLIADQDRGNRILLQRQFALCEESAAITMTVQRQMMGMRMHDHSQRISLSANIGNDFPTAQTDDFFLYLKPGWATPCARRLANRSIFARGVIEFGDFFGEEFYTGSPWLTLDLRSTAYPGTGVSAIHNQSDLFHVEVIPLEIDPRLRPPIHRDMDGYSIPALQKDYPTAAPDPKQMQHLTSDYLWCYFTLLPSASYAIAPPIFLEINQRRYPMAYHPGRNQFELRILLKQGVYNYRYAYPNECNDRPPLMGNYRDNDAEYYALLYYQDPALRYPRLIAWIRRRNGRSTVNKKNDPRNLHNSPWGNFNFQF